jgi:hypothetical protein
VGVVALMYYLVNPQTLKSTGIPVTRDQLPNFIFCGPYQNVTTEKPESYEELLDAFRAARAANPGLKIGDTIRYRPPTVFDPYEQMVLGPDGLPRMKAELVIPLTLTPELFRKL